MPAIHDATDALVKIAKTTICGTDLHILKGDVPSWQPGRILGHEGVGTIEKIGSGVTGLHPGDHVLISCISACGRRIPIAGPAAGFSATSFARRALRQGA